MDERASQAAINMNDALFALRAELDAANARIAELEEKLLLLQTWELDALQYLEWDGSAEALAIEKTAPANAA